MTASEELLALRRKAEEECRAEIAAVLERHACAIYAVPEFRGTPGGSFVVVARVVVVSKA